MYVVLQVIIAFLAAGGLLALGWLLFGRLLAPIGGGRVVAVVSAQGGGENLEHDVAGLMWLRTGGMADFDIVIADEGLDRQGLAVATALLQKEPGIVLRPRATDVPPEGGQGGGTHPAT